MAEDVIKLFTFKWDSTSVYIHAKTIAKAIELFKSRENLEGRSESRIKEINGEFLYEWDKDEVEPIEMTVEEINKERFVLMVSH